MRVLGFYGMHILYFPLLVFALRGLTHWQSQSAWQWPGWVLAVATLAIAAGLYICLGYTVTRALAQAEAAKLDASR